MDFKCDLQTILPIDPDGFAIIEANYCDRLKPKELRILNQIIDTVGELSSKVINNLIRLKV